MFKDVPPHLVRLASACLDQVAPAGQTAGNLATATERACAGLEDHLQTRLGQRRAQALLVLGLTLARADFPVLADLTATPDGRLPAFDPVLKNRPFGEVHAALVALLAHTLGLVATLEGQAAADQAARAVG